jgi:hypothetical protein
MNAPNKSAAFGEENMSHRVKKKTKITEKMSTAVFTGGSAEEQCPNKAQPSPARERQTQAWTNRLPGEALQAHPSR